MLDIVVGITSFILGSWAVFNIWLWWQVRKAVKRQEELDKFRGTIRRR